MRMIGGLAAMLLLAGCDGASGTDLGAARAADTANARAIKVTAMEVSQAFLRNADKARQTYDNRVLYVSGEVKDIDFGLAHRPVIKLRGAHDAGGWGVTEEGKVSDVAINGLSNDDAEKVVKGQALTVTCDHIDEVMSGAQLIDCRIKA